MSEPIETQAYKSPTNEVTTMALIKVWVSFFEIYMLNLAIKRG